MKNLPDTRIGKWISWISALVSLLIITFGFFHISNNPAEIIYASVTSFLLVACIFYIGFYVSRKERYANISPYRHYCIHILRDLTTFLEYYVKVKLTDNDVKMIQATTSRFLKQCLDNMAVMFSMLTGTKCRAAIKAVKRVNDKLYVFTLSRDSLSMQLNAKDDKKRLEKLADPIEKNEDFQILHEDYGPENRCFFCNNLTIRRNYKSSTFDFLKKYPPKEITFFYHIKSFLTGKDDWPLPYKSTIVWPIQQSPNSEISFEEAHCIGFLAIDSESRGVFKKKWDFDIGAEIADALYHVLKFYLKLIYKEVHNAGREQ